VGRCTLVKLDVQSRQASNSTTNSIHQYHTKKTAVVEDKLVKLDVQLRQASKSTTNSIYLYHTKKSVVVEGVYWTNWKYN
jgi:hypothetical protein